MIDITKKSIMRMISIIQTMVILFLPKNITLKEVTAAKVIVSIALMAMI